MTTPNLPSLAPAALEALDRELRDLLPIGKTFWARAKPKTKDNGGEDLSATAVTATDLRDMAAGLDVFSSSRYVSDRPIIGPIIGLVKTTLAAFGSLLLRLAYGRQATFNFHAWTVALSVHELEARVRDLERRVGSSAGPGGGGRG
jgi:hypothetical protein